ncbi:MAG: hypothetical protein HY534_01870 [Chloroflexi bacterium]|nr:hypothetical protein [Chloroflexota bacterium]
MPRSFLAPLVVSFLAVALPDARGVAADVHRTYVYDLTNPGWAYCCDVTQDESWVRIDGRLVGLPGPGVDVADRPIYVLAPEGDGWAYTGDVRIEANWIRIVGWEQALPAPAAGPRIYQYDLTNPGWAYCCDPGAAGSWVRIDGRALGLPAPPPDGPERLIYVMDARSPGDAYVGDAATEANWIRVAGWAAARPTPTPTVTPTLTSTAVPATVPPATATLTPLPTLPPLGPTPVAGAYAVGAGQQLTIAKGSRDVRGLFLPLDFPTEWAGRMMLVRRDTATDIWLLRTFVQPSPGDRLYGCDLGPGCVEDVVGESSTRSLSWRVKPGRYFLLFPQCMIPPPLPADPCPASFGSMIFHLEFS